MARFRIKEPYVDAVKVSDILAQAKGSEQLSPSWLSDAVNMGQVQLGEGYVQLGETRAYGEDYVVCAWGDGPGALSVIGAERFEGDYVAADAPATEATAPDGTRVDLSGVFTRHGEIGRILRVFGGRRDLGDMPSILDLGAELQKDAEAYGAAPAMEAPPA